MLIVIYVTSGPTNLFEMENGPKHLFLRQKKYRKRKWFHCHFNIWEYLFSD